MKYLDTKIKLYAAANGVANINFRSDVMLQDDGNGVVYIHEWNLSIAEPTDTQLASYESAATTEESLQTVSMNMYQDSGSTVSLEGGRRTFFGGFRLIS